MFWHGPMPENPLLYKACFGQLSKHPGGAEVEISVLFADGLGELLVSRATWDRAGLGEPPSERTVEIAGGRAT